MGIQNLALIPLSPTLCASENVDKRQKEIQGKG